MPLRFHVSDEVTAVLRAAEKQAAEDLKKDIAAALGDEAADDSDDSLVAAEPAHVTWNTLHRCWRLVKTFKGSKGVPASLDDVIASTSVYHRDPNVEWRLSNPDRKAAYKLNKQIRQAGQDMEYRYMTNNIDVVRKEEEKVKMTMKYGFSSWAGSF